MNSRKPLFWTFFTLLAPLSFTLNSMWFLQQAPQNPPQQSSSHALYIGSALGIGMIGGAWWYYRTQNSAQEAPITQNLPELLKQAVKEALAEQAKVISAPVEDKEMTTIEGIRAVLADALQAHQAQRAVDSEQTTLLFYLISVHLESVLSALSCQQQSSAGLPETPLHIPLEQLQIWQDTYKNLKEKIEALEEKVSLTEHFHKLVTPEGLTELIRELCTALPGNTAPRFYHKLPYVLLALPRYYTNQKELVDTIRTQLRSLYSLFLLQQSHDSARKSLMNALQKAHLLENAADDRLADFNKELTASMQEIARSLAPLIKQLGHTTELETSLNTTSPGTVDGAEEAEGLSNQTGTTTSTELDDLKDLLANSQLTGSFSNDELPSGDNDQ